MTADLIAFLRGRLEEDEARARALPPGPWVWREGEAGTDSPGDALVGADGQPVLSASDPDEYSAWIIRADGFDAYLQQMQPARVLAEVEAKRRTLIRCEEELMAGAPRLTHFIQQTIWEMSLPYADHPDYREEWRP
ncbi:DUF6221 family protein [Streptomyces albidoflavus]|uniref:DUF6221 family protein n=1 Tax=Streptomyces albidoflavus TaxID=1886 RepID=UPI003D0D74CE